MSEKVTFSTDTGAISEGSALPVGLAPTPTLEYVRHTVRARQAAEAAGPSPVPLPIPIPIPWPLFVGPRVLIWKQDPTVAEIGIRKVFLPRPVQAGPHDARIGIQGLPRCRRTPSGTSSRRPAPTPSTRCTPSRWCARA